MNGFRTILEPHICIFPADDGGYHLSHNFPPIPGRPDLNAFDIEDSVMRAAAGLLRLRGHHLLADGVMAIAREVRADSKAFDTLTAPHRGKENG